jgi:hypothetical protein
MAIVACAQKLGRYPRDLREVEATLGLALPVDPFTGKPMLYKEEPGGFVVYSTGPDLKDDNGRELNRPSDLLTQHGDVAFRVHR